MPVMLTEFEHDIERAHYYALGAMHRVYLAGVEWDHVYAVATGFTYYYTRNVSKGLAGAWKEYEQALTELRYGPTQTEVRSRG